MSLPPGVSIPHLLNPIIACCLLIIACIQQWRSNQFSQRSPFPPNSENAAIKDLILYSSDLSYEWDVSGCPYFPIIKICHLFD
jgi:hypothetical protein